MLLKLRDGFSGRLRRTVVTKPAIDEVVPQSSPSGDTAGQPAQPAVTRNLVWEGSAAVEVSDVEVLSLLDDIGETDRHSLRKVVSGTALAAGSAKPTPATKAPTD